MKRPHRAEKRRPLSILSRTRPGTVWYIQRSISSRSCRGLSSLPAGAMPPSAGGAAVGSHVGGIRIWRGRLSHLGVFLILFHALSPSAACTAGGTHIPRRLCVPYYTTERAICQER